MTATPPFVTLAGRVERSGEVLVQEVGGEAVLLDMTSERYFGLDPIGARVWALLGEHDELQHVFDHLCSEYEAEPERIRTDLLALLNQLSAARLIRIG